MLQEPNADSVSWNTEHEDVLCFSGRGFLNIKAGNFPTHQTEIPGIIRRLLKVWWWLDGIMVTVSDLRSTGRKFNSQPFHCQVATLGKLFTHSGRFHSVSTPVWRQLQGPHHQQHIRCLSGVWSGTTLRRASVQLSKPSDATYSARPVGQPGCSCRLPQPGQLTIGEELLGYHNNNIRSVTSSGVENQAASCTGTDPCRRLSVPLIQLLFLAILPVAWGLWCIWLVLLVL